MAEATATQQQEKDSHLIVSNSLILIGRRAVLLGFSAVLVLFLPRYLGDEGLGQFAFAQSVGMLFTTVLTLGLGKFLTKEIARNRSLIDSHLGAALGIKVFTALLVVVTIIGIVHFTNYSESADRVLYIATATAIVLSFATIIGDVLYGLEEMSWPAFSDVGTRVIVIAIGIPVLIQGMGVVAYASVILLATVVHFGLNVGYLTRRFRVRISFDKSKIKFLVVGGLPFILMGFLLDIYGQTDTVVLRIFTGEAVVGWYAAANNIYKAIDMLPLAITTALLPTLSRIHVQDADSSTAIVKKTIAVGALGIMPLAVGLSLFSDEVIATLPYPDAFQNTVPLLTILALTIPVTAFLVIIGTIAIATDRQKEWMIALVITVVLNIVFNIIAAPYFQDHYGNGGIGVALTTLGSELLMVVFGVWLMPKGVIDRAMAMTFLKIGVSVGVMAGVVLLVRSIGLGPAPTVVLGGITYATLALVTRAISTQDLRFVMYSVRQKLPMFKAPKGG